MIFQRIEKYIQQALRLWRDTNRALNKIAYCLGDMQDDTELKEGKHD